MGKFIDLGLRKPGDPTWQDGWTVSFGGLLGRSSAPKPPEAQANQAPAASPQKAAEVQPQLQAEQRPAWQKIPPLSKPSGYDPNLEDEMRYPLNPKDRRKLPQK
jgi:hypothetical protein